MKYVKKLPPTDRRLSDQLIGNGWNKIKEPSNLVLATLLSLPLAFLLSGIVVWLAYWLKPTLFGFLTSDTLAIAFKFDYRALLYILCIFAYMLLHELVHAVFIPDFARSTKTVFGLNGLFGFVSTTEPLKKSRYIVISVMPFVLISLLPLILLFLLDQLNWYTLGLCLINAAGSCVDFLNVLLIAFQVKDGRTIISNGFETYYSPSK